MGVKIWLVMTSIWIFIGPQAPSGPASLRVGGQRFLAQKGPDAVTAWSGQIGAVDRGSAPCRSQQPADRQDDAAPHGDPAKNAQNDAACGHGVRLGVRTNFLSAFKAQVMQDFLHVLLAGQRLRVIDES